MRITRTMLVGILLGTVSGTVHGQATRSPHGDLPDDMACADCHAADAWTPLRTDIVFRHDRDTDFGLVGAHEQVACAGCHLDFRFDEPDFTEDQCEACHVDVHQGNLVQSCATCHNAWSFQDVDGIQVHQTTTFPLTGAHVQISCESCHVDDTDGAFSALDTECSSCHGDALVAAQSFNHSTLGDEADCLQCHGTAAWGGAGFDHLALSDGFELIGAHGSAPCASCHTIPGYDLIHDPTSPDDCVACHEADYTRSHVLEGFETGTTCATCHGPDSWSGAEFDHVTVSNGFELVGAHAPLACESCHVAPGFSLTFGTADQNDCVACHQSDYETAHVADGFETGGLCADCHGTDTWTGAEFDHVTASNGFELVGAHAPLACESCHVVPGFDLLFQPADGGDCVACHDADYQTSHVATGFETTTFCAECHTTDTWTGAEFDHVTASNGFELVGAHAPLACESCHVVPGFELLFQATGSGDCIACHQSEYETSHVAAGFDAGTVCADCHSNDVWSPATFDHATAANGFDLTGAHAPLACESCHVLPGFTLLQQPADQNDCFACHDADYQSGHIAQGLDLGTLCSTCHTTDTWQGAEFDHDGQWFPIYSGPHREKWDDCQTCHNVPGDFMSFTCLTCHEHNKSAMDDEHSGERDYAYDSDLCLSCHPDGRH